MNSMFSGHPRQQNLKFLEHTGSFSLVKAYCSSFPLVAGNKVMMVAMYDSSSLWKSKFVFPGCAVGALESVSAVYISLPGV